MVIRASFKARGSTFEVHCSKFTVRCSLFDVHCSMFTKVGEVGRLPASLSRRNPYRKKAHRPTKDHQSSSQQSPSRQRIIEESLAMDKKKNVYQLDTPFSAAPWYVLLPTPLLYRPTGSMQTNPLTQTPSQTRPAVNVEDQDAILDLLCR
jgi:hypothetical protein